VPEICAFAITEVECFLLFSDGVLRGMKAHGEPDIDLADVKDELIRGVQGPERQALARRSLMRREKLVEAANHLVKRVKFEGASAPKHIILDVIKRCGGLEDDTTILVAQLPPPVPVTVL
jgi:hypothetical protein